HYSRGDQTGDAGWRIHPFVMWARCGERCARNPWLGAEARGAATPESRFEELRFSHLQSQDRVFPMFSPVYLRPVAFSADKL
ncbi:MAG: hypothetical protein ACRD2O_12465, partial [Terriglobia bacterium]